ncbi:MAG: heterodisulfide reductase subunit [Clostridia bacterium]|jgi:heterodisulfide reductase subunit C|nr:heterodisulfide reductase subunit [Clostridia bacterium]MDN5323413.1 heterodisulfide reductase subunit [Clostridia bacterium]
MERIELTAALAQGQELLAEVTRESGVRASKCYQCGKCSAGCPVAFAMDKTPREIMRLLQLGLMDEALQSHTIWLCACCDTCSTRCPREVDIARVMETLRIIAKKKGYVAEKKMDLFHDLFLKSVEKHGRVHEMGLILGFNISGMQPLKDAHFGPSMLLKGKLSPLPHTIKDNGEVKKIFANVRKRGGKV